MDLKAILKKFLPTPAQKFTNEINSLHSEIHILREEIETLKTQKERDYYLDPKLYPHALELWYQDETGDYLDLENPKSFNEKIQWLKIYDSTPLKTRLADKYLVREWVKEKIGAEYLVPLLGVWDRFDDINFSELPDSFVLKCNHGSGWNVVVKDKKSFDINAAKIKFNKWMKTNFAFQYGFELHYKDIPRKIIAEQYLECNDGLKDYRFYCFNGKPEQCWVDMFSGTPQHIRSIYDMSWNKLSFGCTWPDGGDLLSEKPKNFELMKNLSKKLSCGFTFVRVDFFEITEKLYMGEMTFTPMSGIGRFMPKIWDNKIGELLVLPKNN